MPELPAARAGAFSRARTVTYEAGASVEEYQALTIDAGAVRPSGDGDDVHAVAAGDAESGENVTIAIGGAVPARVEEDVTAGDMLGSSLTSGAFGAGGGDAYALTDAGSAAGLSHGGRLDSDLAMVNL